MGKLADLDAVPDLVIFSQLMDRPIEHWKIEDRDGHHRVTVSVVGYKTALPLHEWDPGVEKHGHPGDYCFTFDQPIITPRYMGEDREA